MLRKKMQMWQRLIERSPSSVKAKSKMNKSQDDDVAYGLVPPNHQYKNKVFTKSSMNVTHSTHR